MMVFTARRNDGEGFYARLNHLRHLDFAEGEPLPEEGFHSAEHFQVRIGVPVRRDDNECAGEARPAGVSERPGHLVSPYIIRLMSV